jgi:hypothetical protein
VTERHITQKQSVRKAEAPDKMPAAWAHKIRGAALAQNYVYLSERSARPGSDDDSAWSLSRRMLRKEPFQALDTGVQTGDIACVTPAQEAFALRTERAAGRDAEAHLPNHGLA